MTPQHAALFLIGCIGSRAAFTAVTAFAPTTALRWLGAIALLPAIGFAVIYAFGLRKTGLEVGNKPIWWNSLRPIHAALWGAFAVSAISGYRGAWAFLAVDTVFGLANFLAHHYF